MTTGYYIIVNGLRIDLPPGTVQRGMSASADDPDEIDTSEYAASQGRVETTPSGAIFAHETNATIELTPEAGGRSLLIVRDRRWDAESGRAVFAFDAETRRAFIRATTATAARNAEVVAELRAMAADVSMWIRETNGSTVRLSLATLVGLRSRLTVLAAKLAADDT